MQFKVLLASENKNFAVVILIMFYFVVSFGACGKTEGDRAAGLSPLEGTWVGACEKFATGSSGTFGGKYDVSEHTFSGSALEILHKDFPAAECDPSTILGSYTMSGTFTSSGSNIDGTITKISSTPSTAAQINNLKALCPEMTFSIGKEANLSTCESFKGGITTSFDIFKINGSELYFGETSGDQDGSTAAKRPSTIDTTRKKVRK